MATTVRPARVRLEDIHQVLLGRDVDAGDGLVEEVQVGFRRQGPSEEDPPALAARQGPDLAVRSGRAIPTVSSACATASWSPRRAPPDPDERVAAHHHDVPTVTGNSQSTGSAWGT